MTTKIVWDVTGNHGPEPVELLSYDGDKYCQVRTEAHWVYGIKKGYLFSSRLRATIAYHWFNSYSTGSCPKAIDPNKYFMSRKEYSLYKKELRKLSNRTSYEVDICGEPIYEVSTLKEALKVFHGTNKEVDISVKRDGRSTYILYKDAQGNTTIWHNKKKRLLVKGHRL